MKTYRVKISFAGFVGCTETYFIDADSKEEAMYMALQEARSDLSIDGVEEEEE